MDLNKHSKLILGIGAGLLISSVVFAQTNASITILKPYNQQYYAKKIKQLYAKYPGSHSANIDTRIATDSKYFLGKPYHLGALGEGKKAQFDKSPIYRTDAFDCQTYVSTILALAESDNFKQFEKTILKVRYSNSIPTYGTRNHFTSVDWNPHNQQNGYIVDITKKLFPKSYKIAKAEINRPAWFAKLTPNNIKLFKKPNTKQTKALVEGIHNISKHVSATQSHLTYVPLTALYNKQGQANMAMFKRIPTGTIIEIVRPNWNIKSLIGTNLNISHLGLGIRVNGVLMYREASSIKHKVVDIPLTKYLKNYLDSKTVKGIHIAKIVKGPTV